jgi:hypothetical protein
MFLSVGLAALLQNLALAWACPVLQLCHQMRWLNKFPNVFNEQIVKRFNVVFQNIFDSHIRSDVAIINTVKRVEFYRITFEVSRKKSCIDTVFVFFLTVFSLNVIKENGNVWRCFLGQLVVKKFVNENLVNAVFA